MEAHLFPGTVKFTLATFFGTVSSVTFPGAKNMSKRRSSALSAIKASWKYGTIRSTVPFGKRFLNTNILFVPTATCSLVNISTVRSSSRTATLTLSPVGTVTGAWVFFSVYHDFPACFFHPHAPSFERRGLFLSQSAAILIVKDI
jgi:hypothetical protein